MQPSPVLNAFTAAAAATDVDRAEVLERESEENISAYGELDLVRRTLTAAYQACADLFEGEPRRAKLIATADDANVLIAQFWPVAEDPMIRAVPARLSDALELAADELGPYPGGRLGAVKAPGETPRVVEEHIPTPAMREELAQRAGVVVGSAGATGKVDSVGLLRGVIQGCPKCASEISASGGESEEIKPPSGKALEYGKCTGDHLFQREKGSKGPWGEATNLWASKKEGT